MNIRKYEWSQTMDSLVIVFPISIKINSKNVDSVITENYVKINIPESKFFVFLDLESEIIDDSANLVIENDKITLFLNKKEKKLWKDLLYKGKNDELKERRKVATEMYETKLKEKNELAKTKKKELERFVLDKSIKEEQDKRDELVKKKKETKLEAEKDLYNFIQNYDETSYSNNNEKENVSTNQENNHVEVNNSLEKEETKPTIKPVNEQKALINNQEKEIENVKVIKNKLNQIFNDDDVKLPAMIDKKNQINQSMNNEIRESSSFKVKLTEKKIPHFAARESLSKEAPYPKSKVFNPIKDSRGVEIDDRNPIWVKEKADTFYNNNDYLSAIQAYNKAIDLDPHFHKCILNRATCFMRLGDFKNALENLENLRNMIESMDKNERTNDAFFDKILVKTLIKIYPIKAITGELDDALYICDQINQHKNLIEDKQFLYIIKDREMIEKRRNSEEKKIIADELLKNGNLEEAEKMYKELLEISPDNEKIISNLSLITFQKGEFDKALNHCTKVLKIIKSLKEKINFKKYDSSFEIKILLRRARSHLELTNLEFAQKDIEDAEKLEIKNERISEEINNIKESIKMKIFEKYNEIAKSFLEKRDFQQSLEYFNKSAAIMKNAPKLEVIKVYLNRIATYIGMDQFSVVESEATRILTLLIKQKRLASAKGDLELLQKLKDIEVILYVRKGFALSKMNRILESLEEYQKALELRPNDEKIKNNIIELKKNL